MNNGTLLAVKMKDRRVFQMLSSVHSVVKKSVFPSVFIIHPKQLHLVQGENKITSATESIQKAACEGACQ